MTLSIGSNIRLQIADCPDNGIPLMRGRLQIKKNSLRLSPFSHLQSKHGFSLLELLIVVVIIASLLTLSLPRFKGAFNNLKFDNFCQILLSRMLYLKEHAGVEQNTYRLNFDLNNKLIDIEVKQEGSNEFIKVQGLLAKDIIIPDSIDIETEDSQMLFYPDGSIKGKDITLLEEQNKATIYVKEQIGKIKLEKNNVP